MRAILAGGGTGGHVIPALAIAQELQKQYQAEVLFIGTSRGIENRLVPAAGFPLRLIEVGALKNVTLTKRIKTIFDLPRSVWESRRILSDFRPDVVIGVGGYASGPAMLAATRMRIPTLAFEPNVVPGLANRLIGPWVSAASIMTVIIAVHIAIPPASPAAVHGETMPPIRPCLPRDRTDSRRSMRSRSGRALRGDERAIPAFRGYWCASPASLF